MGYVIYDSLIQEGLFVIALIGLVYRISHKEKNNCSQPEELEQLFFSFSTIRGTT